MAMLARIAKGVEDARNADFEREKREISHFSQKKKPSHKLQAAINWLQEHPDRLDESCRQLEDEIGVSYRTINTAQQLLREGNFLQ